MLIDMHAHTKGISRCCRVTAPEVVMAAKAAGLDGIVLTNHYQKSYVTDGDYAAFARRYVEEFHFTRQCGEADGCRVLYGIEVTMERYTRAHMLVYGVGEDFLLRHPTLFDYTQEELFHLVHENGGILVQAHPYRRSPEDLLDPALMDGVEISCHPLYTCTYAEEMRSLADRHGLVLTCGGDYHADTRRPVCGMYLPDTITCGEQLAPYLTGAASLHLLVDEIDEQPPYEMEYKVNANHNKENTR
ncbi:MAG: hypothetical protein IJW51_02650 [Clostridia bacterium]|nr:hypothetical protein [Clostridia bacterium]